MGKGGFGKGWGNGPYQNQNQWNGRSTTISCRARSRPLLDCLIVYIYGAKIVFIGVLVGCRSNRLLTIQDL